MVSGRVHRPPSDQIRRLSLPGPRRGLPLFPCRRFPDGKARAGRWAQSMATAGNMRKTNPRPTSRDHPLISRYLKAATDQIRRLSLPGPRRGLLLFIAVDLPVSVAKPRRAAGRNRWQLKATAGNMRKTNPRPTSHNRPLIFRYLEVATLPLCPFA